MCPTKRIAQTLAAVALACGLSLSARAQVGSGWTAFTETFNIQTSNGATATAIPGGYEFKSPNNGSGAVNRAEQRFATMPANSVVQWQGDLLVKSLTGDRIAVKQCHQITISSFLIIDITKAGGTTFIILSGPTLGSYTIGTTIRMTTIMNNKTGVVDIYFNGAHVGSKSGGLGGGGMYDKCGAYVSRSGTGGLDDTWVNLKFWIGGTTSGGNPPSAPVFSPAPGAYTGAQSVTITSSGSTSIHYTTDGSTPTASSPTYSTPVTLSATTTLSAIGVNSSGSSPVTSGVYAITIPPPSAPVFSPAAGTYSSTQSVTITSSGSTSIRYTTDGSTPTASSTLYTGPVVISSTVSPLTLSAIGVNSGGLSPVTSGVYTITSPPPVFNFEAESMSPVGTGATVSISNDANASGGVVEFLNSHAAGQIMTFTTPSIPAGIYQIQLRYWGNVTRGQHTVTIDGTQLGATIDQYATSKTYVTVTLGTMTFASSGTHSIAMTVTGKRSAATQFYITADKFTFTGQ